MELPIPEHIKKLWDVWNLRGCIILSLSLQAFLVFFGSFRQRCRSSVLTTMVWASYLLADWVAAVAIGLITQSQGQAKACDPKGIFSQDLAAFWASFLLLHLGGPDSITAFALEDNEFWLRHLFGLVLQVLAAGYSFYMTLWDNKLWPPTLLVFMVGIVKYAERTRALYLASLDRFGSTALPEPDPGPDYEEASTTYSSRLLDVPTQAEMITMPGDAFYDHPLDIGPATNLNPSNEIGLLAVADKLFGRFKGVIVGFYLTTRDRELTRSLFLKADHKSAFRLVEYELSLMFQVLHTKIIVARSRTGYVLRSFCFLSLVASFVCFFLVEKTGFVRFETALTYTLLAGALFLDLVSAARLAVSDQALLDLGDRARRVVPDSFLTRQKWSRLVNQYSLVNYCVDDPPGWLYRLAGWVHASGIVNTAKIMWCSSEEAVTRELEKFAFEYAKEKAEKAKTLSEALEASLQRGDSALSKCEFPTYIKLKWSVGEFQYAESVLLWHIATDICCHKEKLEAKQTVVDKRKCKILSDYMFYLLIMQTNMLSPILGNWYVVFQDTLAEAKRFFEKHSVRTRTGALDELAGVKVKFRPAAVKGLKSKSVFFDSCILAQQLWRLEAGERWAVMDRIWVEFMCFAAVNCRPIVHAHQQSRGGELLTFTWLMMTHLGMGLQFSEQEEQAGTKMVAIK